MKIKPAKLTPVIIVLIGIAFFRIILFLFGLYAYKVYNEKTGKDLPISTIINFTYIFPPVILFTEATTYYLLRKRLFLRKYVRLHIWITFFSSFFIPLAEIILMYFILPFYLSMKDMISMTRQMEYFLVIGLWTLFWFARLFFIIAIRKSSTSPKEPEQTDESTGFLNEFTD